MPTPRNKPSAPAPTRRQIQWLRRGIGQPGGKLPLFDDKGQHVGLKLVEACIKAGWVERWFENPLKPDWLVCRLTDTGRGLLATVQPVGKVSNPVHRA
ncbi:hypothetical protein [Arenibaculum sp.]|jgi:hypothetical protein|uniref:hypothetical protein n=1 Tax=Arenibaculum sp. TaxID=2865862 RepID=UPI002E161022|nr:hypothetical protein [Arenibaculum sp.]